MAERGIESRVLLASEYMVFPLDHGELEQKYKRLLQFEGINPSWGNLENILNEARVRSSLWKTWTHDNGEGQNILHREQAERQGSKKHICSDKVSG